jgi:hypothetical protein
MSPDVHGKMPMVPFAAAGAVGQEALVRFQPVGDRASDVATLDEPALDDERAARVAEHRVLDAVGLLPPTRRAVFGPEPRRQLGRFAQAEDNVRLIGQLVGVVAGPLPELAAVVDHPCLVAEP